MTSYTDVFGGASVPPAISSFDSITLAANATFQWPYNYSGTGNVISKTMEITCSAGVIMTLPGADEVSTGEDFLVRNIGAQTLTIVDAASGAIASISAGAASYLYITDNSTSAGTWGIINYGVGSSSIDASELAGKGLAAIGNTLNAEHDVYTSASGFKITETYRSKVINYTGGAESITFDPCATLGDGFSCMIRNSGNGTLTLDPDGSETIDGSDTMLIQPGESLIVACSGLALYSIGYGKSTLYQFTQLILDVSAAGTFTLTSGQVANKLLTFVGSPAGATTIVVPAIVAVYYLFNNLDVEIALTVKVSGGTGVSIAQSQRAILFCDGTDVFAAQSASVSSAIALVSGSASNPSLNFQSKTNTGLYLSGTEDIGFAVDGSSVATMTSTGISTVRVDVTTGLFDNIKITQTSTTDPFVVEDSASTDATPFVIDAGGNVIVGHTAVVSTEKVQLHGTNDATGSLKVSMWSADAASSKLKFNKSRSATIGTNTVVQDLDDIGSIDFYGADGTNQIVAASIRAEVNGTPGSNDMPGRLILSTTADGASSVTDHVFVVSTGSVGIGAAPAAGNTLSVSKAVTGATSGSGVYSSGVVQSDVTTLYNAFSSVPATQAASFTLTGLSHFSAAQGTIGASSTVTNQYGFFADATLSGATNNYGFYSNIAAATDDWNFYAAGTAANYFAGNITTDGDITLSSGLISASGNITSTGGNIAASAGTITASGNITSSAGNIAASAGTITASGNIVTSGGKLGVGITPATATGVSIDQSPTGATAISGVLNKQTVQSDVTSSAELFKTTALTQAASFTLTDLKHYSAVQSTIGASSTVTNQYGFVADSTLSGATNNYGFYSNVASSSGDWNFYAAGTAANYFGGLIIRKQLEPDTVGSVMSAANIIKGIVITTTSTGYVQLPTGTDIETTVPNIPTDSGFEFSIQAGGSYCSLSANTGNSIVGSTSIYPVTDQFKVARFFSRKTATNTFVTYRIG